MVGMMVAPFMGAWIEMQKALPPTSSVTVAPFMGAWIEIVVVRDKHAQDFCRTLHGCVD